MTKRGSNDHDSLSGRLLNEQQTTLAMIRIFCSAHHGGESVPCKDCLKLYEYATLRLTACPFQEEKPTCGNCKVHCYKREMRDRIRQVMRYAGPRMVYRHPIMALRHLLDGRRPAPDLPRKKKPGSD
jgi:hypothetical protein